MTNYMAIIVSFGETEVEFFMDYEQAVECHKQAVLDGKRCEVYHYKRGGYTRIIS